MGLASAHGVVQWLAADAALTTYLISGLNFTPVAIEFEWSGIQSATDATANTVHSRRGKGFAVGTSSRRCVATQNQDNVADATLTSGHFTDCVAATVTATGPARDGALDLDEITSDGFRLIVDDQAPVNITVRWRAWGGSDVTAVVGDIAEPAATGEQDYSATGLRANGAGYQVVLFAGCQQTADDTVTRTDDGICLGAASSPSEQWVLALNGVDNAATMTNRRYGVTGSCLAAITVGSTTLGSEATLTRFNNDGFRLNWTTRSLTDRRYIFLAIHGGRWQVGQLLLDRNSVGNTATATTPFQPLGSTVICTDGGQPNAPATPSGTDQLLMSGSASGPTATARHGFLTLIPNQATSNIDLEISYDQLGPFGVFGLNSDIDAFLTTGFRIIYDGPSVEAVIAWNAYVTFGVGDQSSALTWLPRQQVVRSPSKWGAVPSGMTPPNHRSLT